jgi:hypothetical protein
MTAITIRGDQASLVTPEGKTVSLPLGNLFERLTGEQDTRGFRPRGVLFVDAAGPWTIWVYEVPPGVRQLKWIAAESRSPFGSGTKYRLARVSLPYLVIFAVFQDGMLSDLNECFFRVAPLADERDELLYPALLNCSRFEPQTGKSLSWICTQNLDRRRMLAEPDRKRRMRKGLEALHHCLLDTGFNYSSESHEFSSWFTESRRVDPRVATIEDWEQASAEDPLFVLDVPWLVTGKTVEQIIARIFENARAGRHGLTADDLARVLIHHGR